MERRWQDTTWTDLVDVPGVVLVPFGSCEQHGPHLPLDTDTRIAVAVAEGAASRLAGAGPLGSGVWVAAPVAYGASGEHQSFPGTISIGHDALARLALELGRSLGDQCRLMVFVNGHGGNVDTLRTVADRLTFEGRPTLLWSPRTAGGDAHAGRTETSLLLAVAPGVVRIDRAEPGATAPLAELLPAMRDGGVAAVSPNGVLGDPTGASAEEGAALLTTMVEDLAAMIVEELAPTAGPGDVEPGR